MTANRQAEENNGTVSVDSFRRIGTRVAYVGIFGNIALTVFKLIAGIVANSGAMVSDAVHSASDVFATFLVLIGINISSREGDSRHPYGHERLECVVAVVLAVILAVVGLEIGKLGIERISLALAGELPAPGVLALVAAVVSIVVKEWMFRYTRAAAKKINSSSLLADAWHHRSDALSSIGSFIGILGARLGLPILDPIVSILICLLILKVAFDIVRDALGKMVDEACDEATNERIAELALGVDGVLAIDDQKTRLFGAKIYVDLEIAVDRNLTLLAAHDIAEEVHHLIERELPQTKHCMIHVNPYLVDIAAVPAEQAAPEPNEG